MAWHAAWSPALLAPDLTSGEKLQVRHDAGQARGHRRRREHPADDVAAGLPDGDRQEQGQRGAGRVLGAEAGAILGIDAASYAKKVASAGPKQFVAGLAVRTATRWRRRSLPCRRCPALSSVRTTRCSARRRRSPSRCSAPSGTPRPRSSPSPTARSRPATSSGCRGSSSATTRGCAGPAGSPVQAPGTDAAGKKTSRTLFTVPPPDGKPLQITLDAKAQNIAEAVLAAGPTTPDLPGRDPALDRRDRRVGQRAGQQRAHHRHDGPDAHPARRSRSSTALALLRAGLTPDSTVPVHPDRDRRRRTYKNYYDYPAGKIGADPAADGVRQLVQHRLHLQREAR